MHKFTYQPLIGGKHKIFIAGDFNNWKHDDLELQESNGIYEIELDLQKKRYEYKFIIDGNWICDDGADEFCNDDFGGRNSVINLANHVPHQIEKTENFPTPNWVKEGIIYQIFTDRFCNKNEEINPNFSEWYYQPQNKLSKGARKGYYHFVEDWNDISPLKDEHKKHYLFYGGDLAGVRSKLDYFIDLGITIIYFNPLVKAESNHKYESFDYFSIDPHFGTNDEFKNLVSDFHTHGIRIIVDFAFNHVGVGHFAFQDCLKNGKNSKYYNWFEWKNIPDVKNLEDTFEAKNYYQCWWGHATMPDLNYDLSRLHPLENYIKNKDEADINWPVVNHILDVAKFWLTEFDIDGFRLDIPNEVPFWFWEMFNNKVKKIKKDSYLVGEIWQNANEWVNTKYFDAVMNYKYFRDPVYDFFLQKINAFDFLKTIKKGLQLFPTESLQVMMNLLDSHDTFRFLESCNNDYEILKLAVLFQMTFIGTPHIFYGDEIGTIGGYDPDNRRPFDWEFDKNDDKISLRNYYQQLIKIRKNNSALIYGEFIPLHANEHCLAYKRKCNSEELIIIINNSNTVQHLTLESVTLPIDILSNKTFPPNEDITIPEMTGFIIKEKIL